MLQSGFQGCCKHIYCYKSILSWSIQSLQEQAVGRGVEISTLRPYLRNSINLGLRCKSSETSLPSVIQVNRRACRPPPPQVSGATFVHPGAVSVTLFLERFRAGNFGLRLLISH